MDSPELAVRFGQFLVSSIQRLADFPEMGRVVPEFGDPAVREIVVRAYRVIYPRRLRKIAHRRSAILACSPRNS